MQAADINALFGFRLECIERMGDQQGLWAWTRLNSLFAWLPLAALVEDRIICMHGGAHAGCSLFLGLGFIWFGLRVERQVCPAGLAAVNRTGLPCTSMHRWHSLSTFSQHSHR
jgi:hypothetical protein